MTKEDASLAVMGAISMALKDPSLQQCFEIICKENAELKKQIAKMKCCENCKYYKPCVTVNETIGNECEDFYNGCNNSVIAPFGKWEIKE